MNLKRYVRVVLNNDYSFTILTKVAAVLIGLVATAYSSRYLGPELKGELGYITSMLTVVAVISGLGLYQPYPFYKRNKEPQALDKFLRLYMGQFVIYSVIGIALAALLRRPALTAVCLITPIQVLANQLSSMIMVEDVKFKNVIFFSARITNTLVAILAFYTMKPMLWVGLAMIVIGDVITVVLALYRVRRLPNPLRADLGFFRRISGFGLVAMVTTLMLTLNYQVDMLMMPWLGVSMTEVGFYKTGASLAEYGWLIPDAFREVLFSRTSQGDCIDEITRALKVNFYLTLLMVLGIVFFGRFAIRLIFGEVFLPAYSVTVILVLGILSMSYFKLIGTLLLAQGKRYMYLALLATSVLVNVAANFIAIPAMGKEGAALASVLSYTVAGAAFLAYYVRTYQVPLRDVFLFRREDLQFIMRKLRRRGGASGGGMPS